MNAHLRGARGLLAAAALSLLGSAPLSAQPRVLLTEREAIQHALGDVERVRSVSVKIGPEVVAAVERGAGVPFKTGWTHCYQGSNQGQVIAYACVDNMIGKERPITYIIRIDHPAGTIGMLEVMEYREAIGGEVNSMEFREQFKGKGGADPLQLHQDIRNLNGATLSSRGLTDGARKIVQLYETVLRGLPAL